VREDTSVRSDSGPCTGFTSTTYIAASSRARGDEADAEDLVAETFLAAFRAAHAYVTGEITMYTRGCMRRNGRSISWPGRI